MKTQDDYWKERKRLTQTIGDNFFKNSERYKMNPDFSQYHTGIDWSLVDAGDWVKQNATLMHPSYKSPIQNAYMIYENANLTDE